MQKPSVEQTPTPSKSAVKPRNPVARFVGLVACGKEKYNVVVVDEDSTGAVVSRRVAEANLSLGPAMGAVLVETGKIKDGASKLWQALPSSVKAQ